MSPEILSLIALIISFIALIISIISLVNSIKQTRIMQEQLNEQKKQKFTDEPNNAYTVKLESIKESIYSITKAIYDLKSEK